MEILEPAKEQTREPIGDTLPRTEAGFNLKHVEFLAHLGMKDSLNDDSVMEKIAYISDRVDFDKFQELALKAGEDGWTSKLDKIYTYMQLSDEYNKLEEKKDLIKQTMETYEWSN